MSTIKKLAPWVTALVLTLALLNWAGIADFHLPNFGFHNNHKTTFVQPAEAEVVKLTPIVLDCRALIEAHVPVEGKKQHEWEAPVVHWHKTYRTDKVTVNAVGDVEACVKGGATISTLQNGGQLVEISADQIKFNRPRVDANKTTTHFQKGWFGKLTDAAPWVSDNNGLTDDGYAFAQSIIGGSKCMKAAWDPMVKAINTAYADQAKSKGVDPTKVRVIITGNPNFNQNDIVKKFHGFEFKIKGDKVECKLVLEETQHPTHSK